MGKLKKAGIVFLFFAALCLCGSIAFSAGGPIPDRGSIVQLTTRPIATSYHRELSTAQIETMRFKKPHAAGARHNPGLTVAEYEFKINSKMEGMRRGKKGPISLWATSVEVDFAYSRMDVYISNQYAEGTCAYKAILDHENNHVTINNRVFEKYRALMEKALREDRKIPLKGNPISVKSMASGKAIVSARIDRVLNPLYLAFKREVLAENAKIDTAASYARVQKLCKDW